MALPFFVPAAWGNCYLPGIAVSVILMHSLKPIPPPLTGGGQGVGEAATG
jgi:hypothetical protein